MNESRLEEGICFEYNIFLQTFAIKVISWLQDFIKSITTQSCFSVNTFMILIYSFTRISREKDTITQKRVRENKYNKEAESKRKQKK